MQYEDVPDFYQMLGVPRDADTAEIEKALKKHEEDARKNLSILHLMTSSRRTLNETIPAMVQALLSGPEARQRYNQRLEASERANQQAQAAADEVRLDYPLRSPFYFNLHHKDTEIPATTLRQMAEKLDREWTQTHHWFAHTTRTRHPLVLFLKHNVLYTHLDNRIEEDVIRHLPNMDSDEAIERCLYLLNPELERPRLAINTLPARSDQPQVYYSREILPDKALRGTITLTNAGPRGCLFGTIESLTPWVTFPDAKSQLRFWVRPKDAQAEEASSFELPLLLNSSQLARNQIHTATLLFHIENEHPATMITAHLAFKVLPLPPRVTFTPSSPLAARATKRGVPTSVTMRASNSGDEDQIPLLARLSCPDTDVSIDPPIVRSNTSVTITIETRNRLPESKYKIPIHVDYSQVPGARGIEKIYIQGEILPTIWGSMMRKKPFAQRMQAASGGGLLAAGISLLIGALTQNSLLAGMLLLTLVLLWPMHLSAKVFITHRKWAGETTSIPKLALWLVPVFICILLSMLETASLLSGIIIAGLLGCAMGFIFDGTR